MGGKPPDLYGDDMTVYELIEQLQNCDMPDAEVFINGNYGKPDGSVVAQRVLPVVEANYSDIGGPVYVEGFLQETK